jgi:hypothetical protein
MTSLRSFQTEIEQIATEKHKLHLKEAKEAHAAAELAKHHGKVIKKDVVVHQEEIVVGIDEIVEVPLEVCSTFCRILEDEVWVNLGFRIY